ncbi:hypothetical protein CSKR_113481 [Clonorchis sinensis]|uniref:Uncharacterized protein n=1 Tax=Clonorchis sinensis TaxID=79923 RepID=A0A419PRA6_CLOSI|nr:hypothetical protein CSKR_113481 [Clonorchis sinensis]
MFQFVRYSRYRDTLTAHDRFKNTISERLSSVPGEPPVKTDWCMEMSRPYKFRNRSHFSRDAKQIYEKTCYSHAASVVSTVTLVVTRSVHIEMAQWLEGKFTDRKVRGSNPTSASRLPLSRVGQLDSIPLLHLPLGSIAPKGCFS